MPLFPHFVPCGPPTPPDAMCPVWAWPWYVNIGVYILGFLILFYVGRFYADGEMDHPGVWAAAVLWPIAWWLIPIALGLLWVVLNAAEQFEEHLAPWLDERIVILLSHQVSKDDYGAIRVGPRIPGDREPFSYAVFVDPATKRKQRRRIEYWRVTNGESPRKTIAAFWGLKEDEYHPDVQS